MLRSVASVAVGTATELEARLQGRRARISNFESK